MSGTHGKASTYNNYGCRCLACKRAYRAHAARMKESRAARLKGDPTLAPHGKRSTYSNWGCRCESCTEANSEACRAYDRSRREVPA